MDSDFSAVYLTAQCVLNGGNILSLSPGYFILWAYQGALVLWEVCWLRLWNDPLCLELVHAVLSAGLVCLLYRMARRWVDERAAQAAALLLTLFPFVLTYHTVLSNQIPSAFFLTLGLWVLVCQDCERLGFWRFPLAGLCLQLGNLLRNDGVIVLVAVVAWTVFECLRHPKAVKRTLLGLAALLAVYLLVYSGANAAVKVSGLNPYGLGNNDPGWKFVLGLNQDTVGSYSSADADRIFSTVGPDGLPSEATFALQNSIILERLSVGPRKLLKLAILKLRPMWLSDALNWAWGHVALQEIHFGPFDGATLYTALRQFDRGLFLLATALMLYGLGGRGWKDYPTAAYLPVFIFFAAFCAFLPTEIQSRYAYLPQLYIFTAAAFGLDRLRPRPSPPEADGAPPEETP